MSDLTRTFMPDLEIRSKAQGGDGRTVVGIAVPYGIQQRIDHELVETFAQGAFRKLVDAKAFNRIPFTRDHMSYGGTLIGKTIGLREDAAGLYGEWRVSATAAGDETLELLKDGVLRELSIGFTTGQDRRLGNGTIERVTATLREVAVVMEGAYGEGALVSAVRAAEDRIAIVESTCNCGAASRAARAAQLIAAIPMLPPAA